MASSQYATDGKLGVNVFRNDPAVDPSNSNNTLPPQFPLGTRVKTANGGDWVYCQLPAIASSGQVCNVDMTTFIAVLATTANTKIGMGVGVAPNFAGGFPIVAGSFGWLQSAGVFDNIQCAAAAIVSQQLNTTVTAGSVGTDATAGSFNAAGLALTTAAAGAGAEPGESGVTSYFGTKN